MTGAFVEDARVVYVALNGPNEGAGRSCPLGFTSFEARYMVVGSESAVACHLFLVRGRNVFIATGLL